ncbi:Uncharacterised protein [Suttonella ornithocola]|uniref:Uncharacterized protein n=1 Tax=Suttonella ornithocola TaxID=279832 RepID=A0A380MVP6_9GAMM|nr:Uncharacterised protein [Suttonella ornithocola]
MKTISVVACCMGINLLANASTLPNYFIQIANKVGISPQSISEQAQFLDDIVQSSKTQPNPKQIKA